MTASMGGKVIATKTIRGLALTALAVGLCNSNASATDGYFQDGFGARQKALAGAGVADSRDATAIADNPAGLANIDDQTDVSMSLFSPQRGYEASGVGPVTPGDYNSTSNLFPVPNFAWTHRLAPDTVFGIGMAGNGGMDTRYTIPVFQGGRAPTGVDLNQMLISFALSQRMGQFSFGVAPILAAQAFKAYGLGGFAGFSEAPAYLSDHSYDLSFGAGVRGGVQYEVMPGVRLGVAGSSRIYMSDFTRYQGLFAEQGSFDIPANLTAGVAVDVRPNMTVMFDYKHIFYSDIPSLAHSSSANALFGSDNGPGFGWRDINVYKLGVEWRYDPTWTFRAGYSYNDSPISASDVMINIVAPGVVQQHITAGAKYKWSDYWDFEVAGLYAPENSVRGVDNFGAGQPIEIRMHQYEGTIGVVYHWDGAKPLKSYK